MSTPTPRALVHLDVDPWVSARRSVERSRDELAELARVSGDARLAELGRALAEIAAALAVVS